MRRTEKEGLLANGKKFRLCGFGVEVHGDVGTLAQNFRNTQREQRFFEAAAIVSAKIT